MKTIFFKSNQENYEKEKDGRKPNTVRFTDDWTKERWNDYYTANKIAILCTDKPESFVRKIVDKTQYKNLVIISWLHPNKHRRKSTGRNFSGTYE
jgi:hypothetical protein